VLDTYWSDHCRHTTFETEIDGVDVDDGPGADAVRSALAQWDEARRNSGRADRHRTLMDLATVAAREAAASGRLDDWDRSEEINACTLKVDALIDGERRPWLLSFKNETHNHPTEIEPYGGASTCLGGAVRDPLSGRAYVHQALRVSGGADPRTAVDQTRPGKLPQRLIAHGAAEGYAGYGNQLGLACAVVREHYHRGYEAKRLECGAVMGASPAHHVVRKPPKSGDRVLLIGGPTGRDGIGGATGSSMAHDGASLEKAGAEVQKGNPPEERRLQRLFRNPDASRLIRRCNDFGAGGVAVAVGELAEGLEIDLDAVPVKYAGLDGLELALSESQERMAVVLSPEDVLRFQELAEEENLETAEVAVVREDRRLRMRWRGETIVDLSRELLDTNGVRRRTRARIEAPAPRDEGSKPFGFPALVERLAGIDVASRRGLEERFDGTVGGTTVLSPRGGRRQRTPAEASVHLLPAEGEVGTAGVMAVGFDPALCADDPFRGGQFALIEALARMVAVGAPWRRTRFSLQEFFGRTDRGEAAWGRPLAALLGALTVQRFWCLPAIGGKDSMSGSFEDRDVPPTLIAFAAAAADTAGIRGAAIPESGLTLALVGPAVENGAPDLPALEASWDWIGGLGERGAAAAAASVGPGGWAAKLVMMGLGNGVGADLIVGEASRPFEADYGRIIVASNLAPDDMEAEARDAGVPLVVLGRSIPEPHLAWKSRIVSLDDLESAWTGTFREIWPLDDADDSSETAQPRPHRPSGSGSPEFSAASGRTPVRRSPPAARPRICLPVFGGTNGEDDALRAFRRAGGEGRIHVFRDRDPHRLHRAVADLADAIDDCQILYLSGGFSAGDEPDGAGKYMAAILRQPRIADAVARLLDRDGLVLGICNGFQALLKSGWLIDGTPGVPGPEAPTLTTNRIGRHVARMVRTVCSTTGSPWLGRMEIGDVHAVPVSHGEGRFVAPPRVLENLADAGRVAFRYCDAEGRPSMSGRHNPNGSEDAVEGLLSPCGRILGKMGHSERWRPGTLIDVPGFDIEQPLIAGGVDWFR